jgi:hypothetical protein
MKLPAQRLSRLSKLDALRAENPLRISTQIHTPIALPDSPSTTGTDLSTSQSRSFIQLQITDAPSSLCIIATNAPFETFEIYQPGVGP